MKKGMIPEQVEAMAQAITSASEQAMQLHQTLADQLEGLEWTGEDRDRFISEFDEVGQQFSELQSAANEMAERATQNATQQRSTSE